MFQVALVTICSVLFSVWGTGGVQIVNCKTNILYLYEDAPEPVTCRNISKDGRNTWKNNGHNRIIGQCTADGGCTNYSTAVSVTRGRNSDESQLEFSGNSLRQFAAYYIICHDDASSTSDSCLLVIRHRPVVSKCLVTSANDTVSGYCFVEKMFSSDDVYRCEWKAKNKMGKEVDKGRGTWGNSMSCSNKDRPEVYCSGNCSFKAPLPKDKGIYNYTIMVLGSTIDVLWQNITAEKNGSAIMTDEIPVRGHGLKYIIVGVSIGLLIISTIVVAAIFSRRTLCNLRSARCTYVSRRSDSSTGSAAQAAGNGPVTDRSSWRSTSDGSDRMTSDPNYDSTVLQEVDIHVYTDLHTREPTYAATSSKKDTHIYMGLSPKSTRSDSSQLPAPTGPTE